MTAAKLFLFFYWRAGILCHVFKSISYLSHAESVWQGWKFHVICICALVQWESALPRRCITGVQGLFSAKESWKSSGCTEFGWWPCVIQNLWHSALLSSKSFFRPFSCLGKGDTASCSLLPWKIIVHLTPQAQPFLCLQHRMFLHRCCAADEDVRVWVAGKEGTKPPFCA